MANFVQGDEVLQVSFFLIPYILDFGQLVLENNHPSLTKLRLRNKF